MCCPLVFKWLWGVKKVTAEVALNPHTAHQGPWSEAGDSGDRLNPRDVTSGASYVPMRIAPGVVLARGVGDLVEEVLQPLT